MLGSSFDGEVLNAARKAHAEFKSFGTTWAKLFNGVKITPNTDDDNFDQGFRQGFDAAFQPNPPDAFSFFEVGYLAGFHDGQRAHRQAETWKWRTLAYAALEKYRYVISDWEANFCQSILRQDKLTLSPKQQSILNKIAQKIAEA